MSIGSVLKNERSGDGDTVGEESVEDGKGMELLCL